MLWLYCREQISCPWNFMLSPIILIQFKEKETKKKEI